MSDPPSAASRQVSWFEAYEFTDKLAADHGITLAGLPIAGTPAWCGMADHDARKLLALVLGGVREALNNDTRQQNLADASREIASAADWSAVARRIQQDRGAVRIPRTRDIA